MTNKAIRCSALLAPLAVVLLLAPSICAQQENAPAAPRGSVEIGVRQIWGDVYGRPDLSFQPGLRGSNLNEYRDLRNGFFVRRADIHMPNVFGTNSFLNIQTESTGFRDQTYLLTFARTGKFKFKFRWDETPHVFSNTGRSPYVQSSPGVFTLPSAIRNQLIANPTSAGAILDGSPGVDLSLRRKTATAGFTVNASEAWTLGFQFSRENMSGARPIGTYSSGYELPEPIDYRTNRIQAGAEYGQQRWAVQFGYLGSIFENKVDTLTWDNGFNTNRGRIDLYPGNSAHNFSFAGAFDLNPSTRVLASIVPGWMLQNDPFVPFSVNPVATPLPALPAQSLHGSKQTLTMNYTLVNHPLKSKRLELTARYRHYDSNNNTPSLRFDTYVLLDGGAGNALAGAGRRAARQSLPYSFNRKNVELLASWEFIEKSRLKLGYEFERYDRAHRDIRQSDESGLVSSVDLNPNKLTLIRLSYRHSRRSPNLYVENVDNYPLGVEPARQQLPEFRRFDEAARSRHRADALVQFSPLPTVDLSGSYGTLQDSYNRSQFGLIKDISFYYTFDANYSPKPQISFFGEYAREKYRTRQRSRLFCQSGDGICAGVNSSPMNDWEANNRSLVDTVAAGVDVYLLKKRVNVSTFYSISASYGSMLTQALSNLRGAGFLLDSGSPLCRFGGCSPSNFPDLSNRLHNVVAMVKIPINKTISPRVEYRYEQYDRVDWQTQYMRPYMYSRDHDSNLQIFLGSDAPSYRAHVLSFSMEFRF